ncbi:MAG TPA: gluconokinase [Stellaceae bacterium]|jgi:carbohydrate kinase (thermoresistant glucokinase family)|nr:gluconokinase [Stellaceae bacterium]
MTDIDQKPIALVLMGVSGCGKSTIAKILATRLHWPFIEGDDLHPPANVEKMSAGIPLNDEDRAPWLAAIAATIVDDLTAGRSCIITCSALKRRYRETIGGGNPQVLFIYLKGDRQMIAQRLAGRKGHFMPTSLLDSQFAALEEPGPEEHALTVEIGPPPDEIAETIIAKLSRR